jgi:hypothetical protein
MPIIKVCGERNECKAITETNPNPSTLKICGGCTETWILRAHGWVLTKMSKKWSCRICADDWGDSYSWLNIAKLDRTYQCKTCVPDHFFLCMEARRPPPPPVPPAAAAAAQLALEAPPPPPPRWPEQPPAPRGPPTMASASSDAFTGELPPGLDQKKKDPWKSQNQEYLDMWEAKPSEKAESKKAPHIDGEAQTYVGHEDRSTSISG